MSNSGNAPAATDRPIFAPAQPAPDSPEAIAANQAAALANKTALMALTNDKGWNRRFSEGDREAIAEFDKLSAAVAATPYQPTVTETRPTDYQFAPRVQGFDNEDVAAANADAASWAADLSIPPNNARSIIELSQQFLREVERAPRVEREALADRESERFLKAAGDPAGITAAQDTLRANGRNIDLMAVARANGSRAAIGLLHHAQVLAVAVRVPVSTDRNRYRVT